MVYCAILLTVQTAVLVGLALHLAAKKEPGARHMATPTEELSAREARSGSRAVNEGIDHILRYCAPVGVARREEELQ